MRRVRWIVRDASARAWRRAALVAILAWIAVVSFHPHFNVLRGTADPFPVHADEFVHWEDSQSIALTGSVTLRADDATTDDVRVHERGFQAYVAAVQVASGIPWHTLLSFAPMLVALVSAILVYAVAERWGGGLSAALWFAAVPTSLRFLGPAFMVPIAFALPLLGAGLYVVFGRLRTPQLLTLLLLASALWTIHTMAAVILTAAAVASALFGVRLGAGRTALVAATAIPLLAAHRQVETFLADAAFRPILPLSPEALRLAGPALYVAAAVGSAALALSRDARVRAAGRACGLLLLGLLGVIAYRASTGLDPFRAFDRSTLIAAYLAAIVAGAGVASVARVVRSRAPRFATVAVIALVMAQAASVAAADRAVLEQEYYVSLSGAQFAAYSEAKAAFGPEHDLALVGPGPTIPFSVVTGIPTLYTRSPEQDIDPEWVRRFFRDGATDTHLLVETGTTIVVTDLAVENPDLRLVAPGVYVLREDYVARMK